MKSAFRFELGSEISPGLVTVGRFDGILYKCIKKAMQKQM